MVTEPVKITETGCYLDSHRGHYITRDVVQFAQGYGFIVDPFAQWAIDTYDSAEGAPDYPFETLVELADEAIEWLNSGQDECVKCCAGSHSVDWPGPGNVWEMRTDERDVVISGAWVICKACSGTGRGPRIEGQNFPPIIPKGTTWDWNDGDFGLYKYDADGEIEE